MAKRVDGWLSETGRVFSTEAEAVSDETSSVMMEELITFFERAEALAYSYPRGLATLIMENPASFARILSPERLAKLEKNK